MPAQRRGGRLVSNARALKVFSLWSSVITDLGAQSPALTRNERLDCEELPGLLVPPHWEGDGDRPPGHADGPLSFILNLWALEVAREDASTPLNPLSNGEINRMVLDGDVGAHRGSRLKARLSFGSQNVRDVDFGQSIRVSAVARYISMQALFPENSIIEPAPTDTVGTGIVLDTIFGVEILASTSPPGDRLATNTETTVVLQTVVNTPIRLQPGARRVTIYQTNVGDVMTPFWSLDDTGAAAGPNLGQIILGTDRRAVALDIPGNAQVIMTGPADPDDDRVITVVQSLEI